MKQREYEELLGIIIESEEYLMDKIVNTFSDLKDILLTYEIEDDE